MRAAVVRGAVVRVAVGGAVVSLNFAGIDRADMLISLMIFLGE